MYRNRAPRARAVRLSALAVAAASTLVAVPFAAAPAHAADPVTIQLLNINDFHGRIDANTTAFATTVEQLRAAEGEDSTLFLSAGDNIGASLFASAVQQDSPTIDVLNALELSSSAVGNHEFDQGADDLTGRVTDEADFSYLGANVYEAGTETPVLPEYATFEVNGLTVGVIGAITEETPTLVSPGGIEGLEFGDPVEAVNRVAEQLSDGDPENGEADVVVAEYHEGAGAGTPDGATLEEEIAGGGAFASIATETSADVDVIFTGHTHKQYAWDAPIPGGEGTRPLLQTGSYGEFVGQVVLSVDPVTGEVVDYEQANVARASSADTELPRVAEVKTIVDDALAVAAEIGNQPIGTIEEDITTAYSGGSYVDGVYTGGSRDDRASESTLGNLVATALRDGVSEVGTADLGMVNPGGLRNELLYDGDTSQNPENTDGVVTYAEANAVLPFVNNVWLVELTGADVKEVLEQQWQRDAEGNVPSRPFLHLGLSDNVDVTFDPNRPEGDRITEILIDGEEVLADATYTVSTFSFLAQGGDNFRAFGNGTSRDTGLVDREVWIDFLGGETGFSGFADFTERQVAVTPALPETVDPGAQLSFTAPQLGLTSQGAPEVTEVEAVLVSGSDGETFATTPVTNRVAEVSVTVPTSAEFGDSVLFLAGSTLLGEVAVSDVPPPPAPGSIATGSSIRVEAPYRYGRVGGAKPFVAFFAGHDGNRVSGTTFVTARKVGTSQLTARAWTFSGVTTRMWTPDLTSAGNWQITVTFVPSDPAYRPAVRSWYLWVTPTGR